MTDSSDSSDDSGPDVITHPPFIYAGGLFIASMLERLYPLVYVEGVAHYYAGGAMIVAALTLAYWCFKKFSKAGTNVPTNKPAKAIVTDGPYKYSRNPIYLALTLLYGGIIVADSNLWGAMLLGPVFYLMTTGVIEREEAYLENKFGEEYLDYKARVGRWFTL